MNSVLDSTAIVFIWRVTWAVYCLFYGNCMKQEERKWNNKNPCNSFQLLKALKIFAFGILFDSKHSKIYSKLAFFSETRLKAKWNNLERIHIKLFPLYLIIIIFFLSIINTDNNLCVCLMKLNLYYKNIFLWLACLLSWPKPKQPTKNHKPNTLQNMTKNGKLHYSILLNLKYVFIEISPQNF